MKGAVINPAIPAQRIESVDVYRGFVMFLMMAEVLSLESVSKALPESGFWRFLAFQQSHVEWTWLSLHDMIQPSFTFLVGAVLPYSVASRKNKGESTGALIRHTLKRSLILILLGIFLRSLNSTQTYFTFEDTLTQIGLGYPFLVALGFAKQRTQLIAIAVILTGYWLAFALYPGPDNPAWAFDRWFLNLFPRENVFTHNSGGYATLSFIPTLATMLLGLQAGNILKSDRQQREKMKLFTITGFSLVILGVLIHISGINPIVKRIWTPAWTIFSGGLCFLFLAFFFGVVDIAGKKKWAFFFKVLGVNSIAAYVIADGGLRGYISDALHTHLGQNYDVIAGAAYAPLINGILVLFLEWLILYWMYKKKIFIKI
jgi:predicted acyltransferase